MHSILKRSAALIASAATLLGGGLLMAGTAQADGIGLPVMTIHPAASTSYPKELVNSSFDYPAGLIAGASTKYPWDDWTVVDPINGRYARHIGVDKDLWAPITGWDASKFAWKSTQTKGTNWQQIAQGVELQKDSKTGNQYAELVAGQAGTALYQDIATIPGVSYRWELKHASLDRTHLDGMSVMIGEPGKESAQDATRTTVNGNGDQPGDVGKVISTELVKMCSNMRPAIWRAPVCLSVARIRAP